ncbi:nitroreductase family protein [Nocardia sp. NPDC050408]|uniref:nitroreductase family protein n=1 Tax=unclassified Nocardia TaxID=2637762 RepID=UPI003444F7F9
MHSIKAMRATRHFLPEPIPRTTIAEIVDTARWTGSARNRQPWRFIAVNTETLRIQLSELGHYAGHLAEAPLVLVLLSADNGFTDTEFDMGRVCQSLCLTAHEYGLGTCVTTIHPGDNVVRAAALLDIEPGWLPRHAIAIGRRDPQRHRSPSAIPTGRLPGPTLLTWA